ncbi:ArsA family ATPase [Thalassiella azotivora]
MRVLLVTGKGGVGKTTTAAATAVHAARAGRKVLVVSTDAAHSLADVLDRPVAARPTEVEPGLSALQVDPRTRARTSWDVVRRYLVDVLDELGVDPMTAEDLACLPGADDVLGLLELRDQVASGPWDVVVVDCAPTAEALRLLVLPEVVGRQLQRLLSPERRIARLLAPGRAGGAARPGEAVVAAARRLTDELSEVRGLLTGPGAAVRVVTTAQRVVLAESRRAYTALALHGYAVDAVVVNQVRREADERDAVREAFPGASVLSAPHRVDEPVGPDALAALASDTYGTADPVSEAGAAEPLRVRRDGDDLVLDLWLPLVSVSDVDLSRQGDDLVVDLGPTRRVLALPAALRRCDVVGATLRSGHLLVRFRPDPDRWRSW